MIFNTGLGIEKLTSGLWDGDLIVIGGRPGMGKMSLACTITHHVVLDKAATVKLLSLRCKEERLKERFVGLATKESRKELINTAMEEGHDFKNGVDKAFETIYQDKLYLDSQPGIPIDGLIEHVKSEPNFGLLIIDNLQLLTDDSKNFQNRWEEMGSICRKIKNLNLELDIPLIVLSHLSREVEYRKGVKRPRLSDLSDSGAIEQVADIVALVYRPEYYGIKTTPEGESTKGITELDLAINNRGPIGVVPLYYVQKYGRFESLVDYSESKIGSGVQ